MFGPREQTLYWSVFSIINIIEPKMRRMIGHGRTQQVHITCPHRGAWVHRQKRSQVRTLFGMASRYVQAFQQILHAVAAPQPPHTYTLRSLACAEGVYLAKPSSTEAQRSLDL